MMKKAIFILSISLINSILFAQTIRYVSQNGAGIKNGSSWANAYDGNHLQNAINEVNSIGGGQVWVTNGTYYPTQDETGNSLPTDPRMKTFSMKKNVTVYGAFNGTETDPSQRTLYYYNNPTTLSGDIGVSGDNTDNCYNVVYADNVDNTAILDGLIISFGNANGNGADTRTVCGGGFFVNSGLIQNCDIISNIAKNDGGGAYITSNGTFDHCYCTSNNAQFGASFSLNSGGTVSNTYIGYNTATCTGGGIETQSGGNILNCYIEQNISNGTSTQFTFSEGGGINASGPNCIISGCTILNNTCSSTQGSSYGGGLMCSYGVKVTNCTISGNTCSGGNGGGVMMYNSTIENSIIRNNLGSSGGGFYTEFANNIRNCLIYNNTSKYDGGGLYVSGTGTNITNGTVANNLSNTSSTPARIQLYVYSSAPGTCNVTNTILTGAQYNGNPVLKTSIPGTFKVNITNCASDGSEIYTIAYAGFKKLTSFAGTSANSTQLNEINAADWTLTSTSYMVNNGTADTTGLSIPTTDVAGLPRISLKRIDIGAYEFQSIRYVTVAGAGLKNGSSWANAFQGDSLQYAINQGLGEVRVASGTYYPKYDVNGTLSSGTPKNKVFTIARKAVVFGGFAGTETDPSKRVKTDIDGNGKIENWEFKNQTIFSGDIGVIGDSTDNCSNVVTFTNISSVQSDSAIVDGVTITSSSQAAVMITNAYSVDKIKNCIITHSVVGAQLKASATLSQCLVTKNKANWGSGIYFDGGGIADNCKVDGNYGATNGSGMYFSNGGIITNSIISNNTAYVGGGAFISSLGTIDNCIISNNKAFSNTGGSPSGGGIAIIGNGTVSNSFVYNNSSTSYNGGIAVDNACLIYNCVIVNNASIYGGGGISMGGEGSKLINCTVANNSSKDVNVNGQANSSTVINSIIAGSNTFTGSNLTINNNAILYGVAGGNNNVTINAIGDLKLVRPTSFKGIASNASQLAEIQNADWSLQMESSLINAGDRTNVNVKTITKDIVGNNRMALGGNVDIGAYELQSIPVPTSISSITVTNDGVGIVSITSSTATCSGYMMMVKEGSNGLNTIYAGQDFTSNTIFSNGASPDGSWYAVSNGKSNTVQISGLTPGTWYRVAVNTFNGINYKVYSPSVDGQNVVKFYAKQPQDITFNAPTEVDGQTNYIPDALASSNLKISFTSSDSSIALPNGNSILILKPGTVIITAMQTGNNQYFAASSISKTIIFGKATQAISFTMNTTASYGDADVALSATTSSGLPVQFVSSNNNVASISNGWLSFKGSGTATISAIQPGNNYFTAANQVSYSITVNKASQSVTFNSIPSKTFGDASFALDANASSGLAVTYTSSNPLVANVAGNIVSIKAVGTATITASQLGNGNYAAATDIKQIFTINQASQNLTFTMPTTATYGDADITLNGNSSANLPIVYTSSNLNVANIYNGVLSIKAAGVATITASIPSNANYTDVTPISYTFTVSPQTQTINFSSIPSKTFGDASFALDANASSGLAVTYTSSNPSVANVAGNIVSIKAVGTATITASQTGNGNYSAASDVKQILTINQASQNLTFTMPTTATYGDADITLNGNSSANVPIVYTSSNLNVANVNNGVLSIKAAGVATITAAISSNANYTDVTPISYLFTVSPKTQTINFSSIQSKTFGDASFGLYAQATSGLAVSYYSDNNSVVSVAGNVASILGGGTCKIYAYQTGNNNYLPSDTAIQSITVSPKTQFIAMDSIMPVVFGTADFTPFVKSESDSSILLTSSDNSIASIVNGSIHILNIGKTTITATQNGTANFKPTSTSRILVVTKAPQTITFDPLNSVSYGEADFVLGATSSSKLPVTYTIDNPLVATMNGAVVTVVGAGKANITAQQTGDSVYLSATSVTRQLTVTKADQSILFNPLKAIEYGSVDTVTPVVSSNSTLSVSIASDNNAVAKIVNGKIVIVGAGDVTITASQSGNGNYNQAANIEQLFTVVPKLQKLTIPHIDTLEYGQADIVSTASASSGLPVSIISSNPAVIQVIGKKLHIVNTGDAQITFAQLGTKGIASVDTTITVTVKKAVQTISFPAISMKKIGNAPFKLFAIASSGLPVVFSSSNTAVAEVVDNEVTIVGTGSCVITASVDVSDNYLAANAKQTLIVSGIDNLMMPMYTITRDTVINLYDLIYGNNTFTFTYLSGKTASASVSGSIATITINKKNKAWIGTDTLWFNATNKNVAGDVQKVGIKIRRRPLVEEIGLVTVDSTTSTKCIVAWERSQHAGIKGYIIYRGGNVTGKWDSIGYVSAKARSLFVDSSANVKKQAYQYSLVTIDSNNVHSPMSPVHTTMHLMTGVNLQNQPQLWWTPYVGAAVETYVIYRKNQTTGKLDSISSSILTSYTDVDAPAGSVNYRVGIRFAKDINPDNLKSDSGPFSSSLSNMAESQLTDNPIVGPEKVAVYPNPAKEILHVKIDGTCEISIIDMLGKTIKTIETTNDKTITAIPIDQLTNGMYILKITRFDGVQTTNFVKE